MINNVEDDPGETNQILSKNPEMSNLIRLKRNQILMELSSMLKLHYMLTLVSSHFIQTKSTRRSFSPTTLNGKIWMTCLIRYVVKHIRRDLQLLYKD